jgi:two-component system chemotaxis sensor kinase CheA
VSDAAPFFDEFIDDFFSECDEHLGTVRRVLLDLDNGADALEPVRLQELLRALHTLKGLSGMVGLSAAEEVAHAMEDGIRSMQSSAGSPELLECLFDGEALLEACIAARRSRTASPSPAAFVDRVHEVIRGTSRTVVTERFAPVAPVAPSNVASVALQHVKVTPRRFDFTPSAELAARGVGVEMIRQRLLTLGALTGTVPRVKPTGGVIFEFTVAVRDDALAPESWQLDGLSWEPWSAETALASGSTGANRSVQVHTSRPTPAATPAPASNVVRVDLARLDDLMRLVGTLVVTRARLGDTVARAGDGLTAQLREELDEANEALERQLRTIREGVMRIRLVQVGEVFERMRFAMRDIARETGKAILLDFAGQDTEIDKLVVDRMLEPLLHLVRNSASHGIESRTERLAVGKKAEGTISLRAQAAGDRIIIDVEDDGAGINVERVGRRARELGLVTGSEPLAPDALLDVICASGFSTRDTADMTSGRGVGMAVVRTTIRSLGGELFVDSILGQGTRFTIELPLTLMITDALILEVGDQSMAIPQVALREILPLDPASVTRFEKNEVLSYRGRVIPLIHLGEFFKLPTPPGAARHVLIVGSDMHIAGLVVDRILGLREIVVHPLDDPLVTVPGVAGATELADGRVSLILDAPALIRGTRGASRAAMRALQPAATSRVERTAPIMPLPEHIWS